MTSHKFLILLLIIKSAFPIFGQDKLMRLGTNARSADSKDTVKILRVLDYVNPFIGTGGHGHTYPGASAPFGMMQLSPDTRLDGWDGCSGYHYSDNSIYGFSHTHLSGTGVEDYCDILFVPLMGNSKKIEKFCDSHRSERIASTFNHQNEVASPGYYKVTMDNNITAEFTVSQRAGIHRYTFPNNGESKFIVIDLTHRDKLLFSYFKQHSDTEYSGGRISSAWAKEQHLYFHFLTSIPFKSSKVIGKDEFLILEFPESTTNLEVKIGISPVVDYNAKKNMMSEVARMTFDQVKKSTQLNWARELSAIDITSKDDDAKKIFYTALYHSYLAPNVFNDINGEYRGMNGQTHSTKENTNAYTVFSLWDTYRATHPWYTIFQTKRTEDFIRSFGNQFEQSGLLPVWELAGNETNCMIGYHAVSVIADAYIKGIKGIDVAQLINAVIKTTDEPIYGRKQFNSEGYISYKKEPESVSKTLEYAYDSHCIYLFLKEAKKDGYTVAEDLIHTYYNRSFNFLNVFDPQTGFMRAKDNGLWNSHFVPSEANFHYTEANSWQYSLYAPHAVPVLADALGGKKSLENWLDSLFNASSKIEGNHQVDITGLIGQYAHGNEPSHHMAYLYNYTDSPEKTAIIVDSILYHYYFNAPDGLSGNEDCGQMSSWYTFSALGLYPMSPGNPIYEFGRPIFDQAILTLENGHRVKMITHNNSRKNKFIQSIKLNGEAYTKRYITHRDLTTAKTIEFTMGPFPSSEYRSYEIAPSEDQVSKDFVVNPFFKNKTNSFSKSAQIEICSINEKLVHYYTTDGSTPTIKSKKYKKPFTLKSNTTVKVVSYNPLTKSFSSVITNDFKLQDNNVSITLSTPYKQQYSASGKNALIDGTFGGNEYRSGDWQGFYEVNANGTIHFSKPRQLSKFGLSALQCTGSWIFPPKEVEFIVTYADKTTEKFKIPLAEIPQDINNPVKQILFEQNLNNKLVQSIEFTAFNFGPNPAWHRSPGYETFIFLDEFYFE